MTRKQEIELEKNLAIIREFQSQIGKKGGESLKGTEAAKIRSAKANAAKKAKSEERRALNDLQKTVDELKNKKKC